MEHLFKENGKQYLVRPAIDRGELLLNAVDSCLDLMYRASYPSITLAEYKKQHEEMTKDEVREAQLYKSHYLPDRIYKTILDDFVGAYELKSDLPDVIQVLKDYFKKPIVDKWIEGKDENEPGHRGYEHPEPMSEEAYKEAEKYMDMANDFFNWNRDYSSFCFNVMNYSPCSNRETVEKWWHEHGDPNFKLPDDSYWVDSWDEIDEEDYEEVNDTFKGVATEMFDKEDNGTYLNNLKEKKDFEYEDATLPEEIEEDLKEIANFVSYSFLKLDFMEGDDKGFHFFIDCPEKLSEKIGIPKLAVCPYKGDFYGPGVTSNYFWTKDTVNDATFFIDIYDTADAPREYIYTQVLQELYNFKRDAAWVLNCTYEEEMEEMKKRMENIEDIDLPLI